jgi:hypothetical protein
LDFGWRTTRDFVYAPPEYTPEFYSAMGPDYSNICAIHEKNLIDTILRRGNDRLIVNILWSTTLYFPLKPLSHEENEEYHGSGYLVADFYNFRNNVAK